MKRKAEMKAATGEGNDDTPLYCGGGCGGIVGFVPKGARKIEYPHIKYADWCKDCAQKDREGEQRKVAKLADEVLATESGEPEASRYRLSDEGRSDGQGESYGERNA